MKSEKQRIKRKDKQKAARAKNLKLKSREPKFLIKTDSEGNEHAVRNPWR